MKLIAQAGLLFTILSVLSGILYPMVVTGIGQVLWPDKSKGSLIKHGDKIVGSTLIAQKFTQPEYFWSRPSAGDFKTLPSKATNLSPTSAPLAKEIADRRTTLSATNQVMPTKIPMDMLTSSGSGLDPHISLAAAKIQVNRVVHARHLDQKGKAALNMLIEEQHERPQFGIFGEYRINVLKLNLAVDERFSAHTIAIEK